MSVIAIHEHERPSWRLPFSVGDTQVIAALPDEIRASVERYVRMTVRMEDADEGEYEQGFRDGVEEAAECARMAAPSRRRRPIRRTA